MTDISRLATYLEGEGYFGCYHVNHKGTISHVPQIGLTTTDADVAIWAHEELGTKSISGHDYNDGRKVQYRLRLSGAAAASLMRALLPEMISTRRKAAIHKALACYGSGAPERGA